MIRLSVPEIEGGTLSVTEKEKDWSWSILVVGYIEEKCSITMNEVLILSETQCGRPNAFWDHSGQGPEIGSSPLCEK